MLTWLNDWSLPEIGTFLVYERFLCAIYHTEIGIVVNIRSLYTKVRDSNPVIGLKKKNKVCAGIRKTILFFQHCKVAIPANIISALYIYIAYSSISIRSLVMFVKILPDIKVLSATELYILYCCINSNFLYRHIWWALKLKHNKLYFKLSGPFVDDFIVNTYKKTNPNHVLDKYYWKSGFGKYISNNHY